MSRAWMMIATILLASSAVAAEPDSSIKIDAGKVLNHVTPLMYGSCIEDVNHEIYGGLYAQMIFGESFEEPPRVVIPGWTSYGGEWDTSSNRGMRIKGGNECWVAADAGAKLIWNEPIIGDGTVECDVRLGSQHSGDGPGLVVGCAGLILRVQKPRVGADAFFGYEVSLGNTGYLRLGRHRNDWKLLKDARVAVKPREWHHLKVELAGHDIKIFLDGEKEPTIKYTDDQSFIEAGDVGLRTWSNYASFRNVTVESNGAKHVEKFGGKNPAEGLSGAWDPITVGPAPNIYEWYRDKPFNSAYSQKIELLSGDGTVGVANRGLNRWGLTFREGRTYAGQLYLREAELLGKVTVALQSADGKRTYAQQQLAPEAEKWQRFDFSLKSSATDTNARFAIWIDKPGTVWVDQVYLSGTGDELFHGLPMRADIGKALQDEGLTVLRYGGCMVNAEGYRWKNMIGDPDKRPQYKGWWYPYTTNGFGIEEFLQFCDAAKFEKVFAINVEETPQDAGDLVEYLNGPATSQWGARRAKNGHPAPYGVKYIEIGNEEKTDQHYIDRFKMLYDAMHARDPSVQFIIAAWWEPSTDFTRRIVEQLDGKAALWDVHVGGDGLRDGQSADALFTRMEKLVHEWVPKTQLKACVLEENGGRHDLQRALGHACMLNATARHGDFVLMDCPANCLQAWKQNDNDWDQGQVFYTSSQVWGMPPYYAQQMAAANHLPCRVASEAKCPADELDVTATRSEDGAALAIKVVNIGDKPHRATVDIAGVGPLDSRADVTTLSGKLTDVNSPDAGAKNLHPVASTIENAGGKFEYEFPAYSFTILKMKRKQ